MFHRIHIQVISILPAVDIEHNIGNKAVTIVEIETNDCQHDENLNSHEFNFDSQWQPYSKQNCSYISKILVKTRQKDTS